MVRTPSPTPSSLSPRSSDEDVLEAVSREIEDIPRARGLESTLEELGTGAYQWRLFALCGCGWMSDNSALACIAVILPRVQIHFGLEDHVVGMLSASTMAGMMIGAVGWGVVSDLMGRALPFHTTLLMTALFGIGASFAPNFAVLCVWLFFMGTAVGGSMPTDGTLFLENLPHSKQYLLTLLSVFFSIGAVLSAVTGFALLPNKSCQRAEGCDIAGGANDGWRHVLFALGFINLLFALARSVLFKLYESPRFLVANGRATEAVVVLKSIAKFNEQAMDIDHDDVRPQTVEPASSGFADEERALMANAPPLSPISPRRRSSGAHGRTSGRFNFSWWHSWLKQMGKLFSPKWRRTVVLMWIIWGAMAFAYTMFNVWLPKVLESRKGDGEGAIRAALRDVVLYAVAGCPGSMIGAWMIQTHLGRKKSLAICTLATGLAVFVFIRVRSDMAVIISSMFISLTGTAMYAVLYGMTPETFGTSIRGTACGTSAALSRLAGVIAPVGAGFLIKISANLPLFATAIIFVLTALCALALPKDRVSKGSTIGVH